MAIIKSEYVHSNIERFKKRDVLRVTTSEDTLINDSIIRLEGIRDSLKEEAEKFLELDLTNTSVSDYLRRGEYYSGIATQVINKPGVIKSLVDNDKVDIKKLDKFLTNKDVPEKIINFIRDNVDEKTYVKDLSKIIAEAFGDGKGVIEIDENGSSLKNLFNLDSSIEDEILRKYSQNVFKRLKKTQAVFKKIVEDFLATQDFRKSNNRNSLSNFKATFSKEFMNLLPENFVAPKDCTPQEYINKVMDLLKENLGNKSIKDLKNAGGATNEEVLVAVQNADNQINIRFELVGNMSDNDIKEAYGLQQIVTFHDNSKQSPTDVLLVKFDKNGNPIKYARAQSKTSIKPFDLKLANDQEGKGILAHVQRAINIFTLLNELNIENVDDIGYVLINSLWFNSHKSMKGGKEFGKPVSSSVTNDFIAEIRNFLDIVFGQKIEIFLGVSVNETLEENIKIIPDASNLFFIENGHLIPTYIELNEVIEDLRKYKEGVTGLRAKFHFVIEKNINWAYPNEETFFVEKWNKNKEDKYEFIEQTGINQYNAAKSSILVHGNFASVMDYTSYTFGK